MADNITAPAAGTVLATDDIAGVHHPLVKIEFGAADSATPVSSSNPLPVSLTGTLPVSLASQPLPTGAATDTTVGNIVSRLPAALGAQAAASSLSIVPGTGASFAVTGTFWQATQPVSLASQPLPTGAATETTLSGMSGKLPASLGAKLGSASFSITPATDAAFTLGGSEVYIGKKGVDTYTLSQTPTVSTAAYAAGDVVGTKMTFAGATRLAAGSADVYQVLIACKSAQTGVNLDLLLFSADPTNSTFTDNAALAVAVADFDKLFGVVHITDWTNLGTPSVAQAFADNIFKLAAGNTIYAVLVTRSAMTLASTSDINVTLFVFPG
jgi:hypothetical protein